MATIIKGSDLMLFDASGQSFAFATNHTFTLNAETSDTSSKDHGLWGAVEVTKMSWEITSENLYVEGAYSTWFNNMLSGANGTAITVKFGRKTEPSTAELAEGGHWNVGTKYYEGKAYITSLVANANNGENATYSVTLTGIGKIEEKTA